MTWDDRWMDLCDFISQWSKDRSTKVGSVIVDDRQVLVSIGWNGFPRGIDDDVELRHDRPLKYKVTEHAERNAIYNAAAKGHPLLDCTLYVKWFPCSDCARAIIQSGLKAVVCDEPDFMADRWGEDFRVSYALLTEAGIDVRYRE